MDPPTIITRNYEDQCGCRTCCTYPNNVWAILPAQALTIIAFAFTVKSIAGCSLVHFPNTPESGIDNFTITTVFNGTTPIGRINNNATYRSLGLFSWENIDGYCVVGKKGDNYDWSTIQRYWQMLAGDFERTPTFVLAVVTVGVAAGIFALSLLLWMVCLTCVAHKRRHRVLLVLLLTIGLPTVHPLMFLLLQTEYCRENKCNVDHWGKYSIIAIFLYFMAGIALLIATKDFPGNPYKEQQPMVRFNLTSLFSPRLHADSHGSDSNPNVRHFVNVNPASVIGMTNYSNGFADAIEIPVESELIDRTLIEAEVGPLSAPNMAMER
jgi:hypothetical protein